jgi:16S rRNA (cytosine967-C5)-methyltransferase
MAQDRRTQETAPAARPEAPAPAPDTDRSIAPRRAALRALTQVVVHKRMLSHLGPDPGLDPAEAARAARLAQTVLRHMGPLDKVIAGFVERPPAPPVRMILRLGAAELLIAGEEPMAWSTAAVALAKSGGTKTARASGLVNAVLRRIAEGGAALVGRT